MGLFSFFQRSRTRVAHIGGEQMVGASSADDRMNQAMETARATIDTFLGRLQNPEPGMERFSIKIAIDDHGKIEHMWANQLEVIGEEIEGSINNQPRIVRNVTLGQRVRVHKSEISDWTYRIDGRIYGNYTLRAALPDLPKAQRASMEAQLAPLDEDHADNP